MARLIDISVTLSPEVPVWPGDDKPEFTLTSSISKGNSANVTTISLCAHTGTHIDAPLHFVEGGVPVDQMAPDLFVGPVQVLDCRGLDKISAADLARHSISSDIQRLLFKTDNSDHWVNGDQDFNPNYVALTPDAAEWALARNIKLVGIDYLSIERFKEPGHKTHHILLGKGIVVIEGLDLSAVEAGVYELMCLPLKLKGADGAPARVFLREIS